MKTMFFGIAGFPGVIGCIDGTHIPIKNPGGQNAEVYRNCKGWMSLNVQVVAGPRSEILDIVIRWPGSAHDSRIFNSSSVCMRLQRGDLPGIFLGDSAYAQTRHVLTPLLNPRTRPENRYNSSQISTRNVVERTFGIWKSRFRCLTHKSQYNIRSTTRIIAASAVLHNMAINRGEQHIPHQMANNVVPNPPAPVHMPGNAIRAAFIMRHFAD
ncbi:hypothetical protein RI129_002830 [Pyrocoelia pectoralis]|uniref:DDE Tnp4 domain-containing protein n=1 Tax=Pyrocoelia pectoralis TaxID=417401 RepID=A0AAN7VP64_9COLE